MFLLLKAHHAEEELYEALSVAGDLVSKSWDITLVVWGHNP